VDFVPVKVEVLIPRNSEQKAEASRADRILTTIRTSLLLQLGAGTFFSKRCRSGILIALALVRAASAPEIKTCSSQRILGL
jgi:hypothetical protein